MNNKINKLFKEVKNKKNKLTKELSEEYNKVKNKYELKINELGIEYKKLKEKYEFKIDGKKIIWNKNRQEELKKDKKSVLDSIFSATVREILSFPFIWIMLIPAFVLDIGLFIYQNTAIRLYKIPITKRSDYIIFDRGQLAYLNWIQKLNCIYCSYFNGLMQFAVEVAGKTERYWCPIKHARNKLGNHNWERDFAEYGNPEEFKDRFLNEKKYKTYIKK